MRFAPPVLALSLVLACVGSASFGRPDDGMHHGNPRATALLKTGDALRAQGRVLDAEGYYESALAADPSDADAYIALGAALRETGMNGRAIHAYRQALQLDPGSLIAIEGEGMAYVGRGAVERARQDLARLRQQCTGNCPELARLSGAIDATERRPVLQASAVTPQPTVTPAPVQTN